MEHTPEQLADLRFMARQAEAAGPMERDSGAASAFAAALASRNAKLVFWKHRQTENVVDMRIEKAGIRDRIAKRMNGALDEQAEYDRVFKELFPDG